MSAEMVRPVAGAAWPVARLAGAGRRRTRVVIDGLGLPQALRRQDGALWFSDQVGDRVYRWAGGAELEVAAQVSRPGGLGFLGDGRLLILSTTDGCVYRRHRDGAFRITALQVRSDSSLGAPYTWARLIDPWLWAALTSAGPMGGVTRRVTALLDHPVIARWSRSPIAPEALAPEDDGSVWVANALRGETVRVARPGRGLERIRTSGHTLAVVLGGPRGRTLIAATVPTLDPEASAARHSGRIELIELGP